MARFDNSIDQDPIQSGLPSDFVQLTGSASFTINQASAVVTSRVFTLNQAASSASASVYWTPPGTTVTDGEVLTLYRLTQSSTQSIATVVNTVRGATDSLLATSFSLGTTISSGVSSNGITIQNVSSVGGTTNLSTLQFDWSTGTWYWVRFSAQSSNYSAKIWELNSVEPSAATITAVSTARTAGPFGCRLTSTFSGFNNYTEIAWFSAATGTDVAPGPAFAPDQNIQILDGQITINKILGY